MGISAGPMYLYAVVATQLADLVIAVAFLLRTWKS